MKNPLAKYALAAVATLLAAAAHAAAPEVRAYVEPDSILIGDRFTFTIEVDKDLVQSVAFPEFAPDPQSGIELVESLPPDTLERDGRHLRVRKRYTMAAFEEGRIGMGTAEVLYADKNIVDTLRSRDSIFLNVATFQIDSTSHPIFDIKPQKNLPFRYAEIEGYISWAALAILLVGVIVFALSRWLAGRGKSIGDLFKPAPPQPPHVVAIKALENLHNQKLWQNNRHKAYYSGLSDILRTYLSERYGIGAMEMTTDEIAGAVRDIEMPKKAETDLISVLRDADLAKFAKMQHDPEQNEADYNKAYYFVEDTKQAEPSAEGDEDEIIDNLTKPDNA